MQFAGKGQLHIIKDPYYAGNKPLCVPCHHMAVRNDRGNRCARNAMRGGEGEEKGCEGGVGVSDHHPVDYPKRVEECQGKPRFLVIVQVHDGRKGGVNRLAVGYTVASLL